MLLLTLKLSLSAHVVALCWSGFYHMRHLHPVLRSLTHEADRTLFQAFMSSCLDYCNSLLYGVSRSIIRKVQSVQNATARRLTGTRWGEHISPVLHQLHLANDIHLVSEGRRRWLCLSTNRLCIILRTLHTQHIWRQELCCCQDTCLKQPSSNLSALYLSLQRRLLSNKRYYKLK